MATITDSTKRAEQSLVTPGPSKSVATTLALSALTFCSGTLAYFRNSAGVDEPFEKPVPVAKETFNGDWNLRTREFCNGALRVEESLQPIGILDFAGTPKSSSIKLEILTQEGQLSPDPVELVDALAHVLSKLDPKEKKLDKLAFIGNPGSEATRSVLQLLKDRDINITEMSFLGGCYDSKCISNIVRLPISRLRLENWKLEDPAASEVFKGCLFSSVDISDSPISFDFLGELYRLDRVTICYSRDTDPLLQQEIEGLFARKEEDWASRDFSFSITAPPAYETSVNKLVKGWPTTLTSGDLRYSKSPFRSMKIDFPQPEPEQPTK